MRSTPIPVSRSRACPKWGGRSCPLRRATMTGRSDRDYEVGYGKPPRNTRWKKGGPSPNPSGRPKETKDLTAIVDRIANEAVQGKGADAGREMSSQEAIYRREIVAAMNGDQRATAWLIR